MSNPTILCIVGDSRSGSTLLQYLLGMQPDVATVGELRRLGQLLAEGRPCSCGAALPRCPRWGPLLQAAGRVAPRRAGRLRRRADEVAGLLAHGRALRALARVVAPGAARQADTAMRLYAGLAARETARVVIDSSKDPGHGLELALSGALPVRLLFLYRDGRAVVHSKVRRTGIDADLAIRHWARLTRAMRLIERRVAGTVVRYENLCADPRATLATVLAPLGVAVRLDDPPPSAAAQHFLGGSPGFAVASVTRLTADESWRRDASPALLARFETLAGALNREIGYRDR